MCFLRFAFGVLLILAFPTSRASSAELIGRVADVQGQVLQITPESDVVPNVGDPFRVVVEVPGVGDASVARGTITVASSRQIVGTIEQASGQVAIGQVAKIQTTSVARRSSNRLPAAVPTVSSSHGPVPIPPPVPTEHQSAPGSTASRFATDHLVSKASGQMEAGREIVRGVVQAIPRLHISGHPVDDEIGRRTVANLLTRLDRDKVFYLQSDIENFRRQEHLVDDQLRAGDISFAYPLLFTVLDRMKERAELTNELLDHDVDFSVDESLLLDPAKTQYPADETAVRETWRKWIKYHLLTHKVAGVDIATARVRVAKLLTDLLQRMHDVDDQSLRNTVLICFSGAFDPETSYLSEKAFADQKTQLRAELVGVGVSLKLVEGYTTVQRILPGGTVDRDGRLRVGDRILGVAQGKDQPLTDVVGKPLADVVRLIRGSPGTSVKLRVLPAGDFESYICVLARERLEIGGLESTVLTGSDLPVNCPAKVGFISMPALYGDLQSVREKNPDYRSVARDLQLKLESFEQKGVDLVALDVRNCQGGPMEEIIDTASLFVGGETVFQSRDRQGTVKPFANPESEMIWAAPLVILTNRRTSGGAELIAAAIQDYDRGLVIGDPSTFGTGTVKMFFDVGQVVSGNVSAPPRLGYVLVTTAKLYRPNGQSVHRTGVVPQLILPSPTSEQAIGQAQERFALAEDSVESILNTGFGYGVDPALRELLERHSIDRRQLTEYFRRLSIAASSKPDAGGIVSLHEPTFRQPREASADDDFPRLVPGTKRVALDGYLEEVLTVALEYAGQVRLAAGNRFHSRGLFEETVEHYRSAIRRNRHWRPPIIGFRGCWGPGQIRSCGTATTPSNTPDWRLSCPMTISGSTGWRLQLEAGNSKEAIRQLGQALELAPPDQARRYAFLRERFAEGKAYP